MIHWHPQDNCNSSLRFHSWSDSTSSPLSFQTFKQVIHRWLYIVKFIHRERTRELHIQLNSTIYKAKPLSTERSHLCPSLQSTELVCSVYSLPEASWELYALRTHELERRHLGSEGVVEMHCPEGTQSFPDGVFTGENEKVSGTGHKLSATWGGSPGSLLYSTVCLLWNSNKLISLWCIKLTERTAQGGSMHWILLTLTLLITTWHLYINSSTLHLRRMYSGYQCFSKGPFL